MVAALILCQLLISALAAAMAASLACCAGLLGWPRRGVWAAAMLCSLALPVIVTLSGRQAPAVIAAIAGSPATLEALPLLPLTNESAVPAEPRVAAAIAATTSTPWLRLRLPVFPSWDGVLTGIWIALSAATLCMLIASLAYVRRLLRGLPESDIDGTRVLLSEDLGPAVFGWLRPTIVLPRRIASSPQRRLVLMHEQSHAAARDPLLFGVLLTAAALAPWNPLLWWQLRQLRFAIEVDCDRRVLRSGVAVASYGEMLLQVAQLQHRLPLGSMALTEPVSQLRKRVTIMTRELSMMARIRLASVSLGIMGLSAALAAQVEAPERVQGTLVAADPASAVPGSTGLTVLVPGATLQTTQSPQLETLQAALANPVERAKLREQRAAQTLKSYAGLVEFLELDPNLGRQLIDLLTDQMLESELQALEGSERFKQEFVRSAQAAARSGSLPTANPAGVDFIEAMAAGADQRQRALRDLLGEARFGRYLDFVSTLPARVVLARLGERLGQEGLSSQQKERMVAVLMAERAVLQSLHATGAPNSPAGSAERLQWLIERRDRLLRAAATILTPSQLAVFERMENERITAERAQLETLSAWRSAANDPAIQPAAPTVERRMLTGRLRWSVTFAVDAAEPKVASFSSNLGEQVGFDAGAGLRVEATPVAYDTERFAVDLNVYETDASGIRHRIDNRMEIVSFGAALPTSQALTARRTVISGSKGYIVAYGAAGSLE